MRHRLRPSPAMLVAVIALIGAMSGLAWAAVKIDTPQIKRGAVTAKKLDRAAVTTNKLGEGAVTNAKLADAAVGTPELSPDAGGVALAGIEVRSDGRVESWFNRLGGQPTVDRFDVGAYSIQPPGFDDVEFGTAIQTATVEDLDGGEIAATIVAASTTPSLVVRTFDSAGNPADRSFFYTVAEGELAAAP